MSSINIIFEDSDVLILDKPSGVTVNRSDTTKDLETVQDWVEEYLKVSKGEALDTKILGYKDIKAEGQGNLSDGEIFASRAGIVHRIDKETSGILLVAKNVISFFNLQSQFKERKVEKTYVALVHGHVKPEEGDIIVPVGRLAWNRKRFGVVAGGKDAITHFKAIEEMQEPYTLLELFPKTGRTHQIRVHLKYINHPVFGDELYAGRKTSRTDRKILSRFFLHAKKIKFVHPKTGKLLIFESKLPKELEDTLEIIRKAPKVSFQD